MPALIGLILIGGESTRMGTDKGEIHYYHTSQRHHLYEMLSVHCENTFLSCNARQAKYITDLPKIEDTYLNSGPLGGILSAFKNYPGNALLTVPCDLPFLNEETITYLVEHRNSSKMATTFWNRENKFLEPLITIWEPCAYPVLLQNLAQDCSSPYQILINSDIELLQASNARALKNVNTTEEYLETLRVLQQR